MGARFRESGLAAAPREAGQGGSLLVARNASYLAHGFQPAREEVARRLLQAALALLEAKEADLPEFPQLRNLWGAGARQG